MEFKHVRELLADNNYVTEFLNTVIHPFGTETKNYTILNGWVDSERSEAVTEKYAQLCAQDGMFLNTVKVIHNPEMPDNAVTVENSADRLRYILLTVIPDISLTTAINFPIIQTMGIMALTAWEYARATVDACRYMAQVQIMKDPLPPILNNAKVEWISIYVGKEKFRGFTKMIDCYKEPDGDPIKLDLNFYAVREMEQNPQLDRLIAAYDADTGKEDDEGIENRGKREPLHESVSTGDI